MKTTLPVAYHANRMAHMITNMGGVHPVPVPAFTSFSVTPPATSTATNAPVAGSSYASQLGQTFGH